MPYTLAMTEAEILHGCKNGDPRAQKQLYDRYKRAMYTVCYRITGDFESANDTLQEAFVKIFTHLDQFRQESTLGAWIKTIVVRTALTKIRKKVTLEPIDNNAGLPDQALRWDHHLDADYLEKAILALPEGYRAVFLLIEVEGYGHKEVAEMLQISEGTSKSQLFHAKKRLRESLQKYGY